MRRPSPGTSSCRHKTSVWTDSSIPMRRGYGSGWGVEWGSGVVLMWDLFFFGAASFLAFSTFSPWEIRRGVERTCADAGLACAKCTTGVSGISIFASKTAWQPGGRGEEWPGSHAICLVFFCFFLLFSFLNSLAISPFALWVLHLFIGGRLCSAGRPPVCNDPPAPWTRMRTVREQASPFREGNAPIVGMPENNWKAPKTGARERDYVGGGDHSRGDLLYGAEISSLGPRDGVLGRAPLESGEERQLRG